MKKKEIKRISNSVGSFAITTWKLHVVYHMANYMFKANSSDVTSLPSKFELYKCVISLQCRIITFYNGKMSHNFRAHQHNLLSLCGATDDLRAFSIIPVTENNPFAGIDEALRVRYRVTFAKSHSKGRKVSRYIVYDRVNLIICGRGCRLCWLHGCQHLQFLVGRSKCDRIINSCRLDVSDVS